MNNGYTASSNEFDSTLTNYNITYNLGPSFVFGITKHSIDVKWVFDLKSSNIQFNKAIVFSRTFSFTKSDPAYPQDKCDDYFDKYYKDHISIGSKKYKVYFQSDISDTLNTKIGERVVFALRPYKKDRYYFEITRINYSIIFNLIREYKL